mmetsp:Transcript_17723/g.47847  ORF Transcript_17723/g.47847 Transcript_17723/m.47847 type:complete len:83 (-) Transcript_17723:189-437(-)
MPDRMGMQSYWETFLSPLRSTDHQEEEQEERARGASIACTTNEFFTDTWHHDIIGGTILHSHVTQHHIRCTCALGFHQQHDH